MIYARVDVNIITHEKAMAAGVEAFGLWVWGMCYAQLHETDGRLPRVAVMSAMGEQRRVLRRLAVRLVSSGLWIEQSDGSFQVANYVTKNQTAEEIAARKEAGRKANAERQARWRNARVTQSNAVISASPDVTVTGLEPEPEPEPTPEPEPKGESAPPEVTARGSRVLRPDEPLTEERRKIFESATANLPARDIEPEWRDFVDHRISASKLFASVAAVDADWRRWVTRQNVIEAKERIRSQNDNGRGSAKRGAEITKQGFDENAPWMKLEGTGS